MSSGLVHWDDPEGWDGEGGGRGVQDGEHMYPWLIHVNVWQKPLQYCKVISLQLKWEKKKKEQSYKLEFIGNNTRYVVSTEWMLKRSRECSKFLLSTDLHVHKRKLLKAMERTTRNQ